MGAEDLFKLTKIDIEKYGFFFWLVIFGFIEIIFSIIYAPAYILLGLLFCASGLLGYSISELMDRISQNCFIEKAKQGDNINWIIKVPLWFHILNSLLKLLVFVLLLYFVNVKYHYY